MFSCWKKHQGISFLRQKYQKLKLKTKNTLSSLQLLVNVNENVLALKKVTKHCGFRVNLMQSSEKMFCCFILLWITWQKRTLWTLCLQVSSCLVSIPFKGIPSYWTKKLRTQVQQYLGCAITQNNNPFLVPL